MSKRKSRADKDSGRQPLEENCMTCKRSYHRWCKGRACFDCDMYSEESGCFCAKQEPEVGCKYYAPMQKEEE